MRTAVLAEFDANNSWGDLLSTALTAATAHAEAKLNVSLWETIKGAQIEGKSIQQSAQSLANSSVPQELVSGAKAAAQKFSASMGSSLQHAADRAALRLSKMRNYTKKEAMKKIASIVADNAQTTGRQVFNNASGKEIASLVVKLGLKKRGLINSQSFQHMSKKTWNILGDRVLRSANSAAIREASDAVDAALDGMVAEAFEQSAPIPDHQLQAMCHNVARRANKALVNDMKKSTVKLAGEIRHEATRQLISTTAKQAVVHAAQNKEMPNQLERLTLKQARRAAFKAFQSGAAIWNPTYTAAKKELQNPVIDHHR